ncbi:hypothetical protein D623_10023468 [Myotis brandtii]|uniref:Uncharacterized protein n=1 Tax=Myotis brandtii TaxID=109478 RepID=S7Q8U2_MYOBR|nr:hypothetical protein D623_10023468 [Myotis brandtii]
MPRGWCPRSASLVLGERPQRLGLMPTPPGSRCRAELGSRPPVAQGPGGEDTGVCTLSGTRTPGPRSGPVSVPGRGVQPLQLLHGTAAWLRPGSLTSATTRSTRLQTSLNCSLTSPKSLVTQALARRDTLPVAAMPVAALWKGL